MQTISEFVKFLKDNNACAASLEWLATQTDPAAALAACYQIDWLEWLCAKARVDYVLARAVFDAAYAQDSGAFDAAYAPARADFETAYTQACATYREALKNLLRAHFGI